MMINKRLIGLVPKCKGHISKNVLFQWFSLLGNIAIIFSFTNLISKLYYYSATQYDFIMAGLIIIVALVIRFIFTKLAARESYLASKNVKGRLRTLIYEKLLKLGNSYEEKIHSSEVVQVAVEGIDQLETYFGSYLPQFFYSMIAPLTLFCILSFINFYSAIILLLCVPLIPITIALVQTLAKKLLSKYWGQYTALGDTFLENLQGLTTMKIYKTDNIKHDKMNEESEHFRKITMKVLTMQLNSITIMDFIAYGGAALGLIVAALQFKSGKVDIGGGLAIILLAAEFFIPMRMLGSYFHIAMNGMAASDKIFKLLDLPEQNNINSDNNNNLNNNSTVINLPPVFYKFTKGNIVCGDLHFSYSEDREILKGIDLHFPQNSFTAIVGESGCGKSTLASLILGKNKNYSGSISINNIPLENISESDILKNITYVGFDSHLFKGTVYDNLIIANENADKMTLWNVLDQVNLSSFLKSENGLETEILENGSNFSGGQRQRLALARAILHNSPVYIFDEATSNIDIESETDIMEQIKLLGKGNSLEQEKNKTVILITHRLANAVDADNIYVMEDGLIKESGTHNQLIAKDGLYKKLWDTQSSLENYKNRKSFMENGGRN